METVLQRILNLLTVPPGNLIVHLVLAFSVLASIQAAFIGKRINRDAHTGRLLFGLGMVLAGQVVLFLASGLAWQGMLDPRLVLPPLDRAVMLFGLVWIVWLWNFAQPARLGDLVTGFLNLGLVLLFIFTYTSWSAAGAEEVFNNSWMDWTWELAAVFIVLTGMAILVFSRPAGWEYGLGMLAISLGGLVAHLALIPSSGNFSGFIRLSQLAAYPLLPNLLNRVLTPAASLPAPVTTPQPEKTPVVNTETSPHPAVGVTPGTQPRTERRRYSSDMRTVHAWLELKTESDPEKIPGILAKAISHTMLADMAFIATGPVYGQIFLHDGYDLVREDTVEGVALDPSQSPALANALQRGRAIRITSSDSQTNDLRTISSLMGLKDVNSVMMIPLAAHDQSWDAILLLSPYSNRQWTLDDQNYLASEIARLAEILQKARDQYEPGGSSEPGGPSAAPSGLEEHLIRMQAEIDSLRQENERLAAEASVAEAAMVEGQAAPAETGPDLNALVALQQEAQDTISGLQAENEQLRQALDEAQAVVPASVNTQESQAVTTDEAERLERDLRSTLQELAHLQNELAKSNAALLMFERQAKPLNLDSSEDREVIAAISQEIRQPMSSILGYTDLLLTESVGILGALQRKFLERIRTSTERMHTMLDDLIQVASMGNATLELLPKPVELGEIIDGAIADTSAQLRDKKIALRVDLPTEMPHIYADRDALQQIVVHLLQNAGAVSPNEGDVTMRVRITKEGDEQYLLLQVTDNGGGIEPELMSRLFSRRLRADKPILQGADDTGVGLSIAKTLTEAHGGRIWAETEQGQSTTFSVLLPLHQDPVQTRAK